MRRELVVAVIESASGGLVVAVTRSGDEAGIEPAVIAGVNVTLVVTAERDIEAHTCASSSAGLAFSRSPALSGHDRFRPHSGG